MSKWAELSVSRPEVNGQLSDAAVSLLTDKIVALSLREVGNAGNGLDVQYEQGVVMGGGGVGFGAVQNLHLLRGVVDNARVVVHLVHLQQERG